MCNKRVLLNKKHCCNMGLESKYKLQCQNIGLYCFRKYIFGGMIFREPRVVMRSEVYKLLKCCTTLLPIIVPWFYYSMGCSDIFERFSDSKINKICIFIKNGQKMCYKWDKVLCNYLIWFRIFCPFAVKRIIGNLRENLW